MPPVVNRIPKDSIYDPPKQPTRDTRDLLSTLGVSDPRAWRELETQIGKKAAVKRKHAKRRRIAKKKRVAPPRPPEGAPGKD